MYGNSLEKFPVEPYSIWKAGPHTFICGDVLEVAHRGLLPAEVDAVYMDPPWDQRMMRLFQKAAMLNYPDGVEPYPFKEFLDALPHLIRSVCPTGLVAYDMGEANAFYFLSQMLKAEFKWMRQSTTTYGAPPRSCKTVIGSFQKRDDYLVNVQGLHGGEAIHWTILNVLKAGKRFFDPCAGKLVYCAEAIKQGATVWGVELIPAKLAQGLERLSRHYEVKREQ